MQTAPIFTNVLSNTKGRMTISVALEQKGAMGHSFFHQEIFKFLKVSDFQMIQQSHSFSPKLQFLSLIKYV